MKYTIERVENGYMITVHHPNLDRDALWVFEHGEDDDDAKALADALKMLVELLRPISKHNDVNVFVAVKKSLEGLDED